MAYSANKIKTGRILVRAQFENSYKKLPTIGKHAVTRTVHAIPTVQTDALAMVLNGNVVNLKWTDIAQKEDSSLTKNVSKKISKLYQNVLDFAKKLPSTVLTHVKKVKMASTVEKNAGIKKEHANKLAHVTNNVQMVVHALDGARISVHVHATLSTKKKLPVAKVTALINLPLAKLNAVELMNKSAKVNVFMTMPIALPVVHATKSANLDVLATMIILLITLIAVETIHHHQKQITAEFYGVMRWTLAELTVLKKHTSVSSHVMEMRIAQLNAVQTMPSALADVHVTKNVQMVVHAQFGMICQTSAQVGKLHFHNFLGPAHFRIVTNMSPT